MCDNNKEDKEVVLARVREYIRRYRYYHDEDFEFAQYWLNAAWEDFNEAGLDSYSDWPERFPITNPLVANKPA